jgi:hypothetical protein
MANPRFEGLLFAKFKIMKILSCKFLLIFFTFFSSVPGYSQINVAVNMGVDTLNPKTRGALEFYSRYVSEFDNNIQIDYFKYWPKEKCSLSELPDIFNTKFGNSHGSVPIYNCGLPTIIYAKWRNDTVQIKTHVGIYDSTGIYTTAILNYYVDITNPDQPKFIIPLFFNSQNWNSKQVRNITYYYPSYHEFNNFKADSLIFQIQRLENDWQLQPIEINYYFAKTSEEIDNLLGYDYVAGMGNNSLPSGVALVNWQPPMVLCSGLGENYVHELVHIYIDSIFPATVLNEGIAMFYGGSRGYSPQFHAERLRKYLEKNPNADFSDLRSYSHMDGLTNPRYVYEWLICKDIYSKEGIKGLKRALGYASLDELMRVEYGAEKTQWNEIFVSLLFDKEQKSSPR